MCPMTSFAVMAGASEGAFVVPFVLFTLAVLSGTFFIVAWLTKRSKDNNAKDSSKPQSRENSQHSKSKGNAGRQPAKKKAAPVPKANPPSSAQHKFDHPHLLTTLKGHTAPLTGGEFSSNGKQFITSAEDRAVFIWNTKDFVKKDRKSYRGNIEFDYAQHICWSPDSKAFIIQKAVENAMEVYKIFRKEDGSVKETKKVHTFPEYNRDLIVTVLRVASNGKFLLTCDTKNTLTLWDFKGKVLDKFDTRHGDTYSATISPCSRFIATTGFTPDTKVYEVKYNKSGGYESLKRVFELKGHFSGIYNCSINCDSSKMVSVAKDGTWRLYNTLVEYNKGQDPQFLFSGEYPKSELGALVSLSHEGRTIAVAAGRALSFYSGVTGDALYGIQDVYEGPIMKLMFDPDSKYLVTIGDKHVRVFHNVAGHYTAIQDLEKSKKLPNTTSAMQDRIAAQIQEAQKALKSFKKSIGK